MREIHPERAAAVRVPALGLLAVLRFPPLDRSIFAARSEDLRVAAPAQRGDGCFVPGQREEFLAVVGVPEADPAITIGAGEHLAVGAEGEGIHPIRLFLELVEQLAGASRINLYQP